MPKYEITFVRETTEISKVEIEAPSEAEAEKLVNALAVRVENSEELDSDPQLSWELGNESIEVESIYEI